MANTKKLTPELATKIITYLKAGNYRETAAMAVGIDPKTMRRWLQLGARGREPYAKFAAQVDEAAAWAEARDITLIGEAAKTDWRAAAWRRERMNPKRWGHQAGMDSPDDSNAELSSAEERVRRRLASLAAAAGAGEAAPEDSAEPE